MNYQKRLNKKINYEEKEKETRRLLYRERKLNEIPRKMIRLKTPIQKGWVRYFVLRDDLLKSKEINQLKKVLSLVQNKWYSSDKSFTNRKLIYPRIKNTIQKPKCISAETYLNLDNSLKKYFKLCVKLDIYGKHEYVYEIANPKLFVLKTEKNFIEKLEEFYPDIESERDYIYRKLYITDKMAYKYTDNYHKNKNPKENYSYRRKTIKRQIQKEIEQDII